ncbi:MAG: DNA ligase D [Alphaproteobacteria bacterium]|nr:DNA ligase D [Alphaproteobacteria bacterium]MBU1527078.1 DNA ligase D [Alphaproteobacteria bacterium]MBU2118051.1 DNA ligase D [Alphaproteobacteria bacterium]MBU2349996.1 DNA ligase D [Alphaproteobacteria bacterium]MBU2382947.1 DNA ligase D [Alphaproteobacteria bacterium]
MAKGELRTYQAKRRFDATPEPKGKKGRSARAGGAYLIQRHAATRLHWDFRIEVDGVLKSWAVTKAPSRDPSVKRLAVEVEDHPLDYGTFEGTIPSGNYGAGTVQLWDTGTWEPQHPDTLSEDWARGSIKMTLSGERLRGGWALVRLKSDRGKPSKRANWLLIKEKDEHAVPGEGDANLEIDASVTTGRSLAEIADGKRKWTAAKPVAKKGPKKPEPRAREAKLAKPPAFTPIQLCKVADHPPGGAGWAHEIKFDGYRVQIATGGGQAKVYTRRGHDWSAKFPELAADAAAWPDGVIDGEVCALNGDHMPDFSALQAAIADGKTGGLVHFAFDLLSEGTEDLRGLPLSHRKARLQAHLDRVPKAAGKRVRYVDHFATTGQAVLDSACRMDLEGVISKKLDAPYVAGRSSTWLKSKCRGGDEVVIGGWSSEGGTRFRSLLVGVREKDGLRSLGRVGTGYSAAVMKTLLPALKAAASDDNPFTGKGAPRGGKEVHWLKPVLVAEIEHGGYTESGTLRHAAFKGLREDKPAAEVTERPQAPTKPGKAAGPAPDLHVPGEPAPRTAKGRLIVAGVTLSNPDKILWPALDGRPAITKADLARYYEMAADRLLPHVADRPVSIIRAPDGITGETFFQRHAMPGSNPRLRLIDVRERKPYVAVADVGGLVAIGQSGGLELHPWGCAPDDPETPDQITFDLDPDEGLDFADVISAARVLKKELEALGLHPFVKTTGGKGLHVVVPIKADARSRIEWDQCKAFAKAVSGRVRAAQPDRFTTTLAKKARGGKIFLDYLRNGRMATAVAPWSPRARPGAGIAFPLSWGQVKSGLDPRAFTLHDAAALLKKPDPWSDFRSGAVSLRPVLKRVL